MIGWWGCGSCGRKVPNDHKGPCIACGGRVRRMVSVDNPEPHANGSAALPVASFGSKPGSPGWRTIADKQSRGG
jgi:hypothetical protein